MSSSDFAIVQSKIGKYVDYLNSSLFCIPSGTSILQVNPQHHPHNFQGEEGGGRVAIFVPGVLLCLKPHFPAE